MTDREKIIKGLECCSQMAGAACNECPYVNECEEGLMAGAAHLAANALSLIKEQEPRVLTLDEVEDALDTVVWVERPGDENWSDGFGLIVMYSHKNGWVCIQCPFGEDPSEDNYDYSDYGKGWRCWSARPTDEQMKAAKWK